MPQRIPGHHVEEALVLPAGRPTVSASYHELFRLASLFLGEKRRDLEGPWEGPREVHDPSVKYHFSLQLLPCDSGFRTFLFQ